MRKGIKNQQELEELTKNLDWEFKTFEFAIEVFMANSVKVSCAILRRLDVVGYTWNI